MLPVSVSCVGEAAFEGRIGIGRFDITPQLGIYSRMWAAAEHDVAQGVHRPLTGVAMCLNSDAQSLVLVALDLGWWRTGDDEWFIRGYVLEALGLSPEQLIINLSHTHSGPSISLSHVSKPGGTLIEPYLRELREKIVQSARAAMANATTATLSWKTGRCSLATNRHYRLDPGGRTIVGFNPRAEAEDTLLVGRVTTADGVITATIVNYACHPTTLGPGNKLLSPDYVGAMRELVEGATGGAPCMFLQGASGELAPREQYVSDVAVADRSGRVLGFAVMSTLESMLPHNCDYAFKQVVESGATLGIWQHTEAQPNSQLVADHSLVKMPLQATQQVLHTVQTECDSRVLIERYERSHHLRQLVRQSTHLSLPLWTWQLGNSFMIGVPAECYSTFQTSLREQYPTAPIAVLNIANGYCSYVPAAKHYEHENYEVQVSLLSVGCLEKLVEAAEQSISRISGAATPAALPSQLAAEDVRAHTAGA